MYLQHAVVWRALSIAVFAVAVVTDFFDGYIARHYEAHSTYGVFLDPLADKFLTFAGFVCLPFIDGNQFPWWAIGVILARDVVVTGMRLWASKKEIVMQTRASAKLKTFSQMAFLYLVLLVGVFVETDVTVSHYSRELLHSGMLGWAMYVIVALTVITGLEYIYFNRDLFRNN